MNKLKNRKVGISFLGGGMRVSAYLGLLKAFEEEDIKLHAILGSSGGAVIGACYALGKTIDEIYDHFLKFRPLSLFNPIRLLRKGGIDYTPWEQHVFQIVPAEVDISDAVIKLCVRAVDAGTGDSTYIEKGSVGKAVLASSAILSKYRFGRHYYMDGDYDPETGVDKLKEMQSDVTIFSYVDYGSVSSLINFSVTKENAMRADIALHKPDFVLPMPLKPGFFLSSKNIDSDFRRGYETTKEFLKSLG